jgi:nitrate reductase delta subunit
MTSNTHILLKLLSFLLRYPDAELLDRLPQAASIAARISSHELKTGLAEVLSGMTCRTLLDLQQTYTAAFDLAPGTTLNMTYHLFGDSEKRAAALARLQQIYGRAGYERTANELPDFLPLMLEFLAVCDDERARTPVWEAMGDVRALADRLKASAPAYAELLERVAWLRDANLRLEVAPRGLSAADPDGRNL